MYPLAAPTVEQFADFLVELVIVRGQRAAGRVMSERLDLPDQAVIPAPATVGEAFSVFHRTADRISRSAVGSITMR